MRPGGLGMLVSAPLKAANKRSTAGPVAAQSVRPGMPARADVCEAEPLTVWRRSGKQAGGSMSDSPAATLVEILKTLQTIEEHLRYLRQREEAREAGAREVLAEIEEILPTEKPE